MKIEAYINESWTEIDYNDFRIQRGIGIDRLAPKMRIWTHPETEITFNTLVRAIFNGSTVFEGYAEHTGKIRQDGDTTIDVLGHGYEILDEQVEIDLEDTSPEDVLSEVFSGTGYTFNYISTDITIPKVDVEQSRRRIISKMVDRAGYTIRFTHDQEIYFEPREHRGLWKSVDTDTDKAATITYEKDSTDHIVNKVKIIGTYDGKTYVGEAENFDYVSEEKFRKFNVRYINSESEAGDMAEQLLRPQPQDKGEIIIGGNLFDPADICNKTISYEDSSKGIDTTLLIRHQDVRKQYIEIEVGEIAGVGDYNRREYSKEEKTQAGADATAEVYETIDDIPDGSEFGKVYADALEGGYHTLASAIGTLNEIEGTLDDIEDGESFGRIGNAYIDGDARILLGEATGDLDDVDDGSTFEKVLATQIDAGEILLAEAIGDLDSIDDGTNYERVLATQISAGKLNLVDADGNTLDLSDGTHGPINTTYLGSGEMVIAKGVELEDGRSFDDITTEDAEKADATVIDGGNILTSSISAKEIEANSITAEEIDTLEISTEQLLKIGDTDDVYFVFEYDDPTLRMFPSINNRGSLGTSGNILGTVYTNVLRANGIVDEDANPPGFPAGIEVGGYGGSDILLRETDAKIIPDSDGNGIIGDDGESFYQVQSTRFYCDNSSGIGYTYPVDDPDGSNDARLGLSTRPWSEVNAYDYIDHNMSPFAKLDPEVDIKDLDNQGYASGELPSYIMREPSDEEVVEEYKRTKDLSVNNISEIPQKELEEIKEKRTGISHSEFNNYVFEVCKEQEKIIESQEGKIEELEERLEILEQKLIN